VQGEVEDVSIAKMTTDERFLSKTLEVCEHCALLVNRWSQFHIDLEAQAKARARAAAAAARASSRGGGGAQQD
jgi:hypothetical protein